MRFEFSHPILHPSPFTIVEGERGWWGGGVENVYMYVYTYIIVSISLKTRVI